VVREEVEKCGGLVSWSGEEELLNEGKKGEKRVSEK
jgi:hypothetical protein